MSKTKGEIWARCGRCHGLGTVAVTTGPAITCPECGGNGSKKVGTVHQEKDLSGQPSPGRFLLVMAPSVIESIELDKFKISISFVPSHLPVSQRTGKAMALYEVRGDEIRCRESKISAKMNLNYITMGDITSLNDVCPDHQHENEYTLSREILDPCDWDASDEATAETVYATAPVTST